MKSFILITFTFAASVASAQIKYTKNSNGLEYCKFSNNAAKKIEEGSFVFLNIRYKNSKDSVLFDTWAMKKQVSFKVEKPDFKADLNEGLLMLAQGDSACFKVNADSLFERTFHQPMPPFIQKGSFLKFDVKVERVTTEEILIAEQKAEEEKSLKMESSAIQNYITANKLSPVKTESGLQYVITYPTKGIAPVQGKKVTVHYTGKLLDGKKFDSSVDRGQPFEFVLGTGQVIKGWDEGIALLKKGEKALLIIPSNLAYGTRGAGGIIKANTPLTFEVELIDCEQ